jgi:hypothetical protein
MTESLRNALCFSALRRFTSRQLAPRHPPLQPAKFASRLDLVSTARQAEVLIFKIRKPVKPVPLAPNRPIG